MTGGRGAAGVRSWGITLAVTSSVCFGGSGVAGKSLIGAGLTPLEAVWLRIGGAVVVLVPIVLLTGGAAWLRTARPHAGRLLAYGMLGVAGCQALYYVAAARLPIGVAILLEFTGPVLVLGWIRFVRRAPVHRSASAGVVVALAGLACVVEIWSGLGFDPIGLAAGAGAAACQAGYFLITERLTAEVHPLMVIAAGSVVAMFALMPLAAPWSMPWRVLAAPVAVGEHAVPGWLTALLLVLVSTVIAYVTGAAAVKHLSAPVAGAICYTEAVAATLAAWLLLHERLGAMQLAGGVVVLAGAYIAQRASVPRALAIEPGERAVPAPVAP